ncbi:MAG: enoyl-CoA hydratase-related protein [Pseudomonadota bacterium]|nr:enoyl-CoA hydratase-related protein [Pseudomonadota bacterium]
MAPTPNTPQDTCFTYAVTDHVAHIQLSRPERRNAMTTAFWDELPALIEQIESDGSVRVIVLSSTGPHFCAGIDLAVFQQIQSDSEQGGAFALYEKIRLMQKSLSALEQCRLPVLAAIQGGAIGGAVDLVTACDLRYCTTDAFFSIEEINVGMTADVGTFPRILKLLPEAVVRELAYTGTRLGAERAERLGFVNAVLPDHDAVVAHTLDVAAEIARKAPLAIVGSKKAITWGRDHSTDDGLQQIALWNAGSLSWRDIQEAISARTEKRPAEFSDLPGKQNRLGV